MSIADKLATVAENTPKVYDAGYDAAESDFWDNFQNYGNRVFYEYAFTYQGWEYIRPKYKIVPDSTSRTICMFQYMPNLKKVEKAYFDLSGCKVTGQGAGAVNGHYATFRGCSNLEVIEDIGMQPGGGHETYRNCHKLHTIEVFRVQENTGFNGDFGKDYELQNITIEGTIGQNGLNFADCTKLTHDSLMSIINALKDNPDVADPLVVTLGADNLAKLTDAEKAIATEKGWTLA